MKVFGVIAFALALALGTGAASAVPTTYEFDSGNPNPELFEFDCAVGGFLNTACNATFGTNGVGVNGHGFGPIPDTDPGNIDSFPLSYETLIVRFIEDFTLFGFSLGNFSRFDDFEYSTNGGEFFSIGTSSPVLFSDGIETAALYIRASTNNLRDILLPDSFTLYSVTGSVASVPVPAGVVLLGTALGALGLAGWRKRKALAA